MMGRGGDFEKANSGIVYGAYDNFLFISAGNSFFYYVGQTVVKHTSKFDYLFQLL